MECTHDLRELALSKGRDTAHIGVSQPYAIALMKGRRLPEAKAINRIADALGVATEVVWAACQESRRRAAAEGSGQAVAGGHVPSDSAQGDA
jgi:predicted transcriptional regulator